MDRAAFLLLFSGVGLGWQPMPDGTNRYEYVVQVEPELLATLSEGQSIPIVGDVPEQIQPIGRVRVVVGRGPAPRQQFVTLMKPVDGAPVTAPAAGDSSIKLTQFYGTNTPRTSGAAEWNAAADRYGAPATTVPPASAPPVTPTYQPSAAANEAYTWNTGESTPAAASGPLAQVGQGLQNAAQPLRDGLNVVDDRFRSAIDKVGDGAKEMFDELGRPLRGSVAPPTPGAPAATNAGMAAAPEWNAPSATGVAVPSAAPPGTIGGAGSAWNQDPAAAGVQPAPRYGSVPSAAWPAQPSATSAASPGAAGDSYEWNTTGDAAGAAATADTRGGAPAGIAAPPQDDPWARADPRLRDGGSVAAASQPGSTSTLPPGAAAATGGTISGPPAWSGNGPPLPPAAGDLAGSTGAAWNLGSASTPPPLGLPAIPEFGKEMLAMPATRPLEGVDPAASGLAAALPSLSETPRPPSTARILDAPTQDWPTRTAATPTNPPTPAPAAERAGTSSPPAGHDNKLAVLVAWVLLTGSIAGNLYLFWSYLDVRQKYRALVRKTARAVGSRFSAA